MSAKGTHDELNTVIIHHRGERRVFRLTEGGYHFDGKRISISIRAWAEDEESPYAANFSLVNYPVVDGYIATGVQFQLKDDHSKGWDGGNIHANAYFDFHVKKLELRFKIQVVSGSELTVELWALTEEYGYADDETPPDPIVGRFRLAPKPKQELWIPT
jgi:hypothetical protein